MTEQELQELGRRWHKACDLTTEIKALEESLEYVGKLRKLHAESPTCRLGVRIPQGHSLSLSDFGFCTGPAELAAMLSLGVEEKLAYLRQQLSAL